MSAGVRSPFSPPGPGGHVFVKLRFRPSHPLPTQTPVPRGPSDRSPPVPDRHDVAFENCYLILINGSTGRIFDVGFRSKFDSSFYLNPSMLSDI